MIDGSARARAIAARVLLNHEAMADGHLIVAGSDGTNPAAALVTAVRAGRDCDCGRTHIDGLAAAHFDGLTSKPDGTFVVAGTTRGTGRRDVDLPHQRIGWIQTNAADNAVLWLPTKNACFVHNAHINGGTDL